MMQSYGITPDLTQIHKLIPGSIIHRGIFHKWDDQNLDQIPHVFSKVNSKFRSNPFSLVKQLAIIFVDRSDTQAYVLRVPAINVSIDRIT